MEKLLRKDIPFIWTAQCQEALDILKEKLVTVPIRIFPDWEKTFNIHVYASGIAVGVILAQPGEGNIEIPHHLR